MFYWWSTIFGIFPWVKRVFVEFGCPGHGKGPWDGLGAVLKTMVRSDILNGDTFGKKITSPADVAEHLRARFATDEWQEAHKDKKIDEIIVFYSGHEEISERAQVEKRNTTSLRARRVYFPTWPWPRV